MKEYRIGHPRYFLTFITLIGYGGIGIWILLFGAWGNILRFVIGPLIIIFTLVFAVPTVYYGRTRWLVNDTQLKIMSNNDFISQCVDFYKSFFKPEQYQVCLQLSQIESITITYKKLYMLYYGYSRTTVYFIIKSKSGDIVQFNALVSQDYKTIIEALQYLEKKCIEIHDPHHILDAIKKGKNELASYLDILKKGGQ